MEITERLAIIETKIEQLEELRTTINTMSECLHDVQNTLTKYKGFIGGVIFVASALGTFFYKFIGPLWQLVKPHG